MDDLGARTTVLVRLLDRMQGGDRGARNELVRIFQARLEHLARKMFRRYPSVGRWVEVEDVLQASLIRLLRALEEVRPASTCEFFGLAAEQMRRELLDLRRRLYGPWGMAANHSSLAGHLGEPGAEPADPAFDPDFERWCRFHEEAAKLIGRDREVVELIYYHGWSRVAVAEFFRVDERTVRRWWESALVRLHEALREEGPGLGRP